MSGCFTLVSFGSPVENVHLGTPWVTRKQVALIATLILVAGLLTSLAGPSYAAVFDEASKRASGEVSFNTKTSVMKPDTNALANSHLTHGLPTIPANAKVSVAKPLMATEGDTAISGRVVTTEGASLPGVVVQFQGQKAVSDASGLYLLGGLPATTGVMTIDANNAGPKGKEDYGYYEVQVTPTAGQTTVLPYLNWLPKIDHKNEVSFPSPTKEEVVITNPALPGLELRLPPGTIVTGVDHKPVRKISITPIPVDRTPFPLPPNVSVPIYFTVQPGGAVLSGVNGKWVGAQVWYPNYDHQLPDARASFFKYDPYQFGWTVYGIGAVSKDQANYVPDAKTRIYNLTSAMINAGNSPPGAHPPAPPKCKPQKCGPKNKGGKGGRGGPGNPADGKPAPNRANGPRPKPPGQGANGGDPVDLASGLFTDSDDDLVVGDLDPLYITRTYLSSDTNVRSFGVGMSLNYESFLWSANQYQEADLIMPDGSRVHYVRTSSGTGYTDAVFTAQTNPGPFFKSTIAWNGGGWNLVTRDGTTYEYPEYAPLAFIQDRYGNRISLFRAGGPASPVTDVTSSNGHSVHFTYTSGVITTATDNSGRSLSYTYDGSKRLQTATDPNGGITTYTWDTVHNRVTAIQLPQQYPSGPQTVSTSYDSNGRVQQQTLSDGSTWLFSYTLDPSGYVAETDVTDPNSQVTKVAFSPDGYWTSQKVAFGTAVEQDYTSVLGGMTIPSDCTGNTSANSPTNYLIASTDALSRLTCYTYTDDGQLLSTTQLAGTSNAITTSYTYGSYNQLTQITDPLGHTNTYFRDALGRPTAFVDGLNHSWPIAMNDDGTVASVADPLANTMTFSYGHGDLNTITDPNGHITGYYWDSLGRATRVTDPLQNLWTWQYDPIWGASSTGDPNGNISTKIYNKDGRVSTFTDPRSTVGAPIQTQYAFDTSDRLTARTDPLGNAASVTSYDGNNNVLSTTDRKGQAATYTYDALNRISTATYADGHAMAYTWDAGNRLTQITDTISGASNTIQKTYDNLNRLTSETATNGGTTVGSVSYTYDSSSRRTSMTVGTDTVNYTWDNADHVTQISRTSGAGMSISYDNVGRPTTRTFSSGIVETTTYDAASNITQIAYAKSGTSIGSISFSYDDRGKMITKSGSLFSSVLPAAVTAMSYNADNQLISISSGTLSYDLNGNLINDGTNTLTWDARDRLIAIGSGASFTYDAVGERQTITVGGNAITYVNDLSNPVLQTSSATTATISNALSVDDRFARTVGGVDQFYLTDLLGTTLAMANSGGAIVTSYQYDPYGVVTTSGAASDNTFQYVGRENDGTGYYFFRARYYSPTWGRFISEDPAGVSGSLNIYAYADGDPISANDPTGYSSNWSGMPGATAIPAWAWRGAAAAEAFGGGPENPVADALAVAALAAGAAMAAMANDNHNDTGDSESSSKPASGSKPIDQTPWSDDHGEIKEAIGSKGQDKVSIDPNGNVWGQNPNGSWTNHGPAENFTGSGRAGGRRGKDRSRW